MSLSLSVVWDRRICCSTVSSDWIWEWGLFQHCWYVSTSLVWRVFCCSLFYGMCCSLDVYMCLLGCHIVSNLFQSFAWLFKSMFLPASLFVAVFLLRLVSLKSTVMVMLWSHAVVSVICKWSVCDLALQNVIVQIRDRSTLTQMCFVLLFRCFEQRRIDLLQHHVVSCHPGP